MRDGFQALFLRESDDADNFQANEDYSGGAKRFVLAPASGHTYQLERLIWTIGDDDADYNTYGNLPALVAGLRLVIETAAGEELVDLLGGATITKTEDLLMAGFEVTQLSSTAGDRRVTQAIRDFETPPLIRGRDGDRLVVIVPADDFSTLEIHTFLAELQKKQFG